MRRLETRIATQKLYRESEDIMSTGKITIKAVWDHLEEIFLIPALAASVIIVFAQVIARYIY